MEKYNYKEAVSEDIRQWLKWHEEFKNDHADEDGVWLTEDTKDEIAEELNDTLWVEDSVTGNGSGSYTFNAWQAEENLCHNLDLLGEALEEFGCSPDYMAKNGPEACDVTIRCYLLPQCIDEVLDEILDED